MGGYIMGYLFSAYAVIWALIAGYLFILGNRQKKLQQEIDMLDEWRDEE